MSYNVAIIDADILVYRFGFATNNDSEDMAIRTIAHFLEDLVMLDLPHCQRWSLHLTGKGNFRDEIAVTAPYKGNRKDAEKPKHYKLIRDYLVYSWDAVIWEGMEADDAIAIEATELAGDGVIVSLDKDLDQVVGWHYNSIYYILQLLIHFPYHQRFRPSHSNV